MSAPPSAPSDGSDDELVRVPGTVTPLEGRVLEFLRSAGPEPASIASVREHFAGEAIDEALVNLAVRGNIALAPEQRRPA